MKRGWILLLLLSLGLNLGLFFKIFTSEGGGADRAWQSRRLGGPNGQAFSTTDTTAWPELARRRIKRIARDLQLTPAQVDSFQRLQAEAATDLRGQRQMLHQARRQLHTLCLADELQPARIRQSVKALALAQGHLDSLVMETMLRELANLTPAQKERYLKMMPWEKSAHGGPGRRGSRGGPPRGGRPLE